MNNYGATEASVVVYLCVIIRVNTYIQACVVCLCLHRVIESVSSHGEGRTCCAHLQVDQQLPHGCRISFEAAGVPVPSEVGSISVNGKISDEDTKLVEAQDCFRPIAPFVCMILEAHHQIKSLHILRL